MPFKNQKRGMLMKGVCFHHNNARPHTARAIADLLAQFGWDFLTHPSYSPDLAPSDFHLFPELKSHLGGTHFQTDEEFKIEVERYMHNVVGEFCDKGIRKMQQRMRKCIDHNGDYIEKIAESPAFPLM